MSEREFDRNEEFERRTKQEFDRSTAALDAATRSRLTRARFRALEEGAALAPRRRWQWSFAPAGAVLAVALSAWLLLWQNPAGTEAGLQVASLNDLEILLAEEDIEMLDEGLEVYGWLEEQPEFVAAVDG
jgi:hypothetical protein